MIRRLVPPLCALLLLASPTWATWIEGGTPLHIDLWNSSDPQTVTDGQSGGYVAYIDYTSSAQVVVSRFNDQGEVQWTTHPALYPGIGGLWHLRAAADGSGGLAFVYYANPDTAQAVIYNRVLADGTTPLGGGLRLSGGTQGLFPELVVKNGIGYAAWQTEGSFASSDIYAQKFTLDGTLEWGPDGLALVTEAADQSNCMLAVDDAGYTYVAWEDKRDGPIEIYAQTISPAGSPAFPDGVGVGSGTSGAYLGGVTAAGAYGAVVSWLDYRNTFTSLYAQLIYQDLGPQWSLNGNPVVTPTGSMGYQYQVVGFPSGNTAFVWSDNQSGSFNLRMQRLDNYGNRLMTTNGLQLTYYTGATQVNISGLLGGPYEDLFMTWNAIEGSFTNAYLKRVSPYGSLIFPGGDVFLGNSTSGPTFPQLIAGPNKGVIATWRDIRNLHDFYAQAVTQTGLWGDPSATLDAAMDVPNDQGGQISLNWFASRLESITNNQVSGYSLWRALPQGKAVTTGTILADASAFKPELNRPVYLRSSRAEKTFFWEYLDTVVPYGLPAYGRVLSTPFDSTAAYGAPITYMVMTHTQTDSVFFMSQPVDGWSVDNLAPGPVKGLRGNISYGPSSVDLAWHPNTEADLDHYNLYRGTTPDFVPDAGSFVATVNDTTFLDALGDGSTYYRLTAVDIHLNEGPDVLLSPSGISGVDTGVPAALAINRVAPNPFNPRTTISFNVRQAGQVRLEIFDVSGRRVRTLVDQALPAGPANAIWRGRDDTGRMVASGAYFARLSDRMGAVSRALELVK